MSKKRTSTPNPPADPARAHRLLSRGAQLLAEGRAREALAPLQHAHRFDVDDVPTLINLGGAYVMTGQHKRALPLLERARDAEPDNSMVWINLGAAYLGNPLLSTARQQDRAIAAFERSLELNPTAPSVHYNLGLIYVDRGDAVRARAAFEQALRVDPQDQDARGWLARLDQRKEGGEDE